MNIVTKKNRAVYVIGAGGHAKVVVSTLQAAGCAIKAIFDDDQSLWDKRIFGIPIRGPIGELEDMKTVQAVMAIGDNKTRRQIVQCLPQVNWVTVIHPAAYVHASAVIGAGAVVFAGAVIQPEARVGAHVIVNTSASIDHDCQLADYVHICPGVHLAGNVNLKEGVFMGIGAVAVPGITVGAWTVVGAGAVVVRDLPGKITAVGVPARPLKGC